MGNHNQPVERKLNMEEKRKLEKMMFADIEQAEREFSAKRRKQREILSESSVKNAPASVRALLKKWQVATKLAVQLNKQIEKAGYRIDSYQKSLQVAYGTKTPEVAKFDDETAHKEKQFAELKRTYTIRLFGGGVEAQQLFKSLAQELARISK